MDIKEFEEKTEEFLSMLRKIKSSNTDCGSILLSSNMSENGKCRIRIGVYGNGYHVVSALSAFLNSKEYNEVISLALSLPCEESPDDLYLNLDNVN